MERVKHNFAVFILESEGASDLVDRRSEGEGLERLLPLMEYKCVLRKADCRAAFLNHLEVFSRSGCEILHISCHGNTQGLGLTNGDFVTWVELFAALKKTNVPFILNLSSCEATGQDELIKLFNSSDDRPFMIAGSSESLTWDEAFIAWGLIYRAHTSKEEGSFQCMCDAMAAIQLSLSRRFRATWFREKKDSEPGEDKFKAECFDSGLLLDKFQQYHIEMGRNEISKEFESAEAAQASLNRANNLGADVQGRQDELPEIIDNN